MNRIVLGPEGESQQITFIGGEQAEERISASLDEFVKIIIYYRLVARDIPIKSPQFRELNPSTELVRAAKIYFTLKNGYSETITPSTEDKQTIGFVEQIVQWAVMLEEGSLE